MSDLQLTVDDVKKITGSKAPLAAEMVPYINRMAPYFEVNTIDRLAEFVGQLAVESMFTWRNEIWGPTPAQRKYEYREDLGNTQQGDGKKFMGHGGIQITGRANTQEFYDWCLDKFPTLNVPNFMVQPEEIGKGVWWVLAAFWYWQKHMLNKIADRRGTKAITRRINGGQNHLEERIAAVDRARAILTHRHGMEGPVREHQPVPVVGILDPSEDTEDTILPGTAFPSARQDAPAIDNGLIGALGGLMGRQRPAPVTGMQDVPRGVVSEPLRQMQRLLFSKGYKMVGAADGRWGKDTRDAAIAFRRDNRLPLAADLNADGVYSASEIMDADFMTAIMGAENREPDPIRAILPTKEIASIVPEVAKARLSKVISGVGVGGAGVPAIGGFIWSQLQGFPDLRAKLAPVFSALSFDIPTWGWFAILACAMGATWYYSRGSEKSGVRAYREGERLAQD